MPRQYPVPYDYIAFSTTATLTSGASYVSPVLSLIGYTQVQTDVLSDKNGTITIQFCSDSAAADVVRTLTIPYVGGSGYQMFSAPAFTPFVKYTFLCTESGQTDFYFDTKLLTKALSPQVLGVDAFISPSMSSTLGRSVIVGRTEGEYYQNISASEEGALNVRVDSPLTAFGEMLVAPLTPVAQVDFVYGLNTRQTTASTTGSGSVTGSGGLAIVSTTAASGSTATLRTNSYVKYRAGEGSTGRLTAIFTTGVAGTKQYAGLATPSLSDGFMFGYDGETFGIWTIKGGSQTHIPQTTWNVDNLDGDADAANKSGMTLDPTQGNVYQIQYQYLGFGKIEFFVESEQGSFILVHRIEYANNYTTPSLAQPSLSLLLHVDNGAVASDIVVKSASMAGFIQGEQNFLGPRWGTNNNKTTVTSATNIFTLKNATTYNTITNRAIVRIRNITFGTNAGGTPSGISTLRILLNATITSPTYTPVSGSTADNGTTLTSATSVVSVDTAGTSPTGGTVIYNEIVAVQSSNGTDVTNLDIFLAPGDTLTFEVSSTQSATVGVGVVWNEDI